MQNHKSTAGARALIVDNCSHTSGHYNDRQRSLGSCPAGLCAQAPTTVWRRPKAPHSPSLSSCFWPEPLTVLRLAGHFFSLAKFDSWARPRIHMYRHILVYVRSALMSIISSFWIMLNYCSVGGAEFSNFRILDLNLDLFELSNTAGTSARPGSRFSKVHMQNHESPAPVPILFFDGYRI
jgi:hypothetical protein